LKRKTYFGRRPRCRVAQARDAACGGDVQMCGHRSGQGGHSLHPQFGPRVPGALISPIAFMTSMPNAEMSSRRPFPPRWRLPRNAAASSGGNAWQLGSRPLACRLRPHVFSIDPACFVVAGSRPAAMRNRFCNNAHVQHLNSTSISGRPTRRTRSWTKIRCRVAHRAG
jgi:hypothetical protein